MNDVAVVADASAILALLKQEPFGPFDPRRLLQATISAVNLSEVLEKLWAGGLTESEGQEAVSALGLQVIAFDEPMAHATARLRPLTRHLGLSLADRACLALAISMKRPAVTADRAWENLDVGVEVVLIR